MMDILNSFFEVRAIEKHESEIWANIYINPDHPIFEAHFPNNPITPGVLLIEIVKELLEEQIGKRFFLYKVTHIKFIKPIVPPAVVKYIFKNIDINDTNVDVIAKIEIDRVLYAKMSLSYKVL